MGCSGSDMDIYEPNRFRDKTLIWLIGGGPGSPKQPYPPSYAELLSSWSIGSSLSWYPPSIWSGSRKRRAHPRPQKSKNASSRSNSSLPIWSLESSNEYLLYTVRGNTFLRDFLETKQMWRLWQRFAANTNGLSCWATFTWTWVSSRWKTAGWGLWRRWKRKSLNKIWKKKWDRSSRTIEIKWGLSTSTTKPIVPLSTLSLSMRTCTSSTWS